MNKKINMFLFDIHTYFLLTISIIIVLQFNLLGKIGLAIYGVLILYSFTFFCINLQKKPIYSGFIFYIAIFYYLYFFFAVCINGSVARYGSSILQLFALTIISFYLRDSDSIITDINLFAKIMIVASIVMSVFSLLISGLFFYLPEFFQDLPPRILEKIQQITGAPSRINGIGGQPNVTARFCLVGLMFSCYMLSIKPHLRWIVLSLSNIFLSLFLIFIATNSRTSMISSIAFLCSYLFFYLFFFNKRKKEKLIIILSIILVIVFVFLVAFFSSNSFRSFILNHVLRISSLSTGTGRLSIYKTAFEMGKGNRLFGISCFDLMNTINDPNVHAHNIFLELLTFSGVPGLILFSFYFFYTIYVSIKDFFHPNNTHQTKKLICFFICFFIGYFVYGIPEPAGVNSMIMLSVFAQLFFAYSHIINYNLQLHQDIS